MPEIEIRPAVSADLSVLIQMEAGCMSSHVWQMDRVVNEGEISIQFREIRLPRPARIDYPRSTRLMSDEGWITRQTVLVALHAGIQAGYIHITDQAQPRTVWVRDLVVSEVERRKGIATALLLAAMDWGGERGCRRMVAEVQSKNFPGISLLRKLGFEFCGYSDQHYLNQDIALFFARSVR